MMSCLSLGLVYSIHFRSFILLLIFHWLVILRSSLFMILSGQKHIIEQFFLRKKERFHSAGYRAQDLSIAGQMLYHLSYGGSTKLFSQKDR